jgi:hypothetical protein
MTQRVKAFAAFWYDFIIGDDWRLAAGVVVALGLTYAVTQTGIPSWWILPTALAILLPLSVIHAVRNGKPR